MVPDDSSAGHAILLALLGAALFLVRRKTEPARLTARAIGIMMAALLGLAILGMISRAASGTASAAGSRPAVALTVLLTLLGAGAIFASGEAAAETQAETIRALRRRIALALGVAFGILTIATGISLWSAYRSQEAARQRGQARAVMLGLATVVDALQEAESAQRGYLLTRDTVHRVRFETARDSLPIRLARLDSLLASSPSHPAGYDLLKPSLTERMAGLAEAVALEDAGRHAEAIALTGAPEGRALGDEIRTRASRLAQQSDSIAQRWDDRLRSGGNVSVVFNVVAGLFALMFLGLAGVAFNRDLGRRDAVERELAAARSGFPSW